MHELGVRLGRVLAAGDLLILTGPLGAGKTTLTRGIGEGLGIRGPVQSPTFVIARTHPSLVGGAPLVHVDAYRLSNSDELDDLDLDFEGSVVVAEWGAGVLDPDGSWIEIEIHRPTGAGSASSPEDGGAGEPEAAAADEDWSEAPVEARQMTLTGHGPRWAEGILS
ncbi:tRNA (adenosine(37)-N6)-threonylcarbamoyltransferase complex ATPase subunit type 1 TsaE [Leucobacter exalbidus]|nr:tRNA (adenosine(37)-N6)-threonylcarbamoyltransferase complex ATPase subunit type 1 TsaE [Leucobacter exalbidus]